MTTLDRAQRAATPAAPSAWRTRDIIVAAVIGVVFGISTFEFDSPTTWPIFNPPPASKSEVRLA